MPAHSVPSPHRPRWSWAVALGVLVALAVVVSPALGTQPVAGSGAPEPGPVGLTPAAAGTSTPARTGTTRPTAARTPTRTPARTPAPTTRRPESTAIPRSASGELAVVPGRAGPSGPGTTLRYRVEIERGLPLDGAAVAAQVHRVLTDPRGWQPIEGVAFARVDGTADIQLIIASPALTDRLCYPLDTIGQLSCRNGDKVVLNALRWATAVPWYAGRMDDYRGYLVNHEVGHRLGHGHAQCPGAGRPAPVMMQQSKGIGACRANPWPAVAAD